MESNVLFIEPVIAINKRSKEQFIKLWNDGSAFRSIHNDSDEILSINSVDKYREVYNRICILYNSGVVEV